MFSTLAGTRLPGIPPRGWFPRTLANAIPVGAHLAERLGW